jgi:hypothetical protein
MARAGISRVDEQSREDAPQKPYSLSPDEGSQRRRVPETYSPDCRCTSKGSRRAPARGAEFRQTIHAHVVRPSPLPRPAQASERVSLSTLSPLIHDLVSECDFHI